MLIKGGRVYNQNSNSFSKADVLIENESVTRITDKTNPDLNVEQIIDASGMYVTPGLIDMHCHIFDHPLFRTSRLKADRIGIQQGVACLVDTGSAGSGTIDAFK